MKLRNRQIYVRTTVSEVLYHFGAIVTNGKEHRIASCNRRYFNPEIETFSLVSRLYGVHTRLLDNLDNTVVMCN